MGAAQHNADIQYKESFITECSITNNVIDTGKNAVLNHEVEVLVSDQVPSDSPDEKAAYVRLILDGDYSTKGEPKASCKYHMVIQGLFQLKRICLMWNLTGSFGSTVQRYSTASPVQKWKSSRRWF